MHFIRIQADRPGRHLLFACLAAFLTIPLLHAVGPDQDGLPGDLDEPSNVAPVPEAEEPTGPFVLYVSPIGHDDQDGLTPATALLTLKEAHEKLLNYKPIIDQDIEIRIKYVSGRPYLRQTVDWTHTSPTHTITFLPDDYHYRGGITAIAGRPVFDGQGTEAWFFYVRGANKGEPTNLRFFYLRIQRYTPGAIAFSGSKSNLGGWNGYNTVYGCYFYELGNKKYPSAPYGYGALDFVNSDNNLIRNNHFVRIENKGGSDASHIHGVYLAHSSDHNVIIANAFSYITGDPIRLRDYSNFNDIFSNSFTLTGIYALASDWRCNPRGECRSWKNEFRENTPISCSYSGDYISWRRLFDDCDYPEPARCVPLGADQRDRIATGGNDPLTCP